LVPFFQGKPVPLTQLSTVCAETPVVNEAARAAVAKSDATVFSFFMILLSRGANSVLSKGPNLNRKILATPAPRASTTDELIVP
jgi:hypothetical protein